MIWNHHKLLLKLCWTDHLCYFTKWGKGRWANDNSWAKPSISWPKQRTNKRTQNGPLLCQHYFFFNFRVFGFAEVNWNMGSTSLHRWFKEPNARIVDLVGSNFCYVATQHTKRSHSVCSTTRPKERMANFQEKRIWYWNLPIKKIEKKSYKDKWLEFSTC